MAPNGFHRRSYTLSFFVRSCPLIISYRYTVEAQTCFFGDLFTIMTGVSITCGESVSIHRTGCIINHKLLEQIRHGETNISSSSLSDKGKIIALKVREEENQVNQNLYVDN